MQGLILGQIQKNRSNATQAIEPHVPLPAIPLAIFLFLPLSFCGFGILRPAVLESQQFEKGSGNELPFNGSNEPPPGN
ncbi:hypothetical protein [Mesorhizobium sp. 1B3]|uniref:hypothetical protein n=1 Tax=Mesorhizobium sp. 1B3 TaxID=3243599 RepID=UPI003D960745